MKLSIITINLNNRDGLQKTIDSIIAQTFHDFEWIVIDGGSTDGSRELIEQYSDHFAYWVSEPDKGIYNAMNKGIKVAKGEYLQFLNSGDWLFAPDTLESVVRSLPDAEIVYGNLALTEGDRITEIVRYPNRLSFYSLFYDSIPHPSSFIRKDLFINDGYDESLRIASDWKFYLKKALEGHSFYHIEITVACFNLTGICSVNRELLNRERDFVERNDIPDCIQFDIHYIDDLLAERPDAQMKKLMEYRKTSKTFHKTITFLLRIFETLKGLDKK